jgi:hypothetical protein
MMRRLTNSLSYSTVLSIVAIAASLTGTAYSASLLTGAQIQDHTITGKKVKVGSLQLADLNAGALPSLRGTQGVPGAPGAAGPKGDKGIDGHVGNVGGAAHAVMSWAVDDTGLVDDANADAAGAAGIPNNPPLNWDDPTSGSAWMGSSPNLAVSNIQRINMTGQITPVVGLGGIDTTDARHAASGGTVTLSKTGALSAVATLSFLHRDYGEGTGSDAIYHGRLECQLRWGNGNSLNSYLPMGPPEWISANTTHGLTTMALTGTVANVQAGTNDNVIADCQDGDLTDSVEWTFASGSLSVILAEQGTG